MNHSDEPRSASATGPDSRAWTLAMTLGLAAGVIGWAVAEAALSPLTDVRVRAYNYSSNKAGETAPRPDSWIVAAFGQDPGLSPAAKLGLRNAVISYGSMGAALGLGLGLAGGLIGRSVSRSGVAGATGLVLGVVAGAIAAGVLAPVYYRNLSADNLTYSLAVHGGTWGTVGVVAGLAFALGLGGWERLPRLAVAGAAGAVLAAAIYDFATGPLFPGAMTNLPVSLAWPTRLTAQALVATFVAAGVVLAAGPGGAGPGSGPTKDTREGANITGSASLPPLEET